MFKTLGRIYEFSENYIENRVELAKLELTSNVSKVISRSITLGIILFVCAIIYGILLLMAALVMRDWLGSYLITFTILLVFHVVVLFVIIKWQNKWLSNFLSEFLAIEFTDVEEESSGEKSRISITDYKFKLKEKNEFIVGEIKSDLRSMFFLDRFEADEVDAFTEHEEDWSEDQQMAFEEIKNLFSDVVGEKSKTD